VSEPDQATSSGKWLERFGRATPAAAAAHRALRRRLKAVRSLLRKMDEAQAGGVEDVHHLRVATRRTTAALDLYRDFLPSKQRGELRSILKRVRRAASEARRADVQRAAFLEANRPAILDHLDSVRQKAEANLLESATGQARRELAKAARAVLRAVEHPKPLRDDDKRRSVFTLGALADRVLPSILEAAIGVKTDDLQSLDSVHELRLTVKGLRYSLELLAGALPVQPWADSRPAIEDLQERLGAVNDAHERWLLLSTLSDDGVVPVDLAHEALADRDREFQRFLQWWSGEEGGKLVASLRSLAERAKPDEPPTKPVDRGLRRHRVAALDVGTNSVRLVVAETDPNRGFRVVTDAKETTRLGGGMFENNVLAPEAMERTVAALGRLRNVAENHHVERLRAIGTAAVREAENQREFLKLAEREAGVEIEVVDADREGRLAFASVAAGVDLGRRRVAVIDIGGGSTEVVFSAGGLIDAVTPLKIGAVRLTERFAHIADPDEQFQAMRTAADELIMRSLPRRPFPIDVVIGCGGTCNNLARLAVRNGAAAVGGGRFLFAVSGCELPRAEVTRILDWLRKLTVEERRAVAGINPDRAEIIVAGACIVERIMDRLDVDRLQVHDGGVRDGLIVEMIDELGLAAPPPVRKSQDVVASARTLLGSLSVDRKHSEQVARLALHLFDQLSEQTPDASGSWASAEARLLLEIGALLHDCGTSVAYRAHHRHGFELIHHSDLPPLTRREREIVALLAFYHRKNGPRDGDALLKPLAAGDQRLVAHLAGLLRIADGLDRSHEQEVSGVRVVKKQDRVIVEANSAARPVVALAAARKKGDVFQQAFRSRLELKWHEPAAALAGVES
jgi:exopolyphosphatase / guanosine-5'-triphosphate,3'-diphosphate pyrophosphatase